MLVQEHVADISAISCVDGFYLSHDFLNSPANCGQATRPRAPTHVWLPQQQQQSEVFTNDNDDTSFESAESPRDRTTSPLHMSSSNSSGSDDSEVCGLTQNLDVSLTVGDSGRTRPVGITEHDSAPPNSRLVLEQPEVRDRRLRVIQTPSGDEPDSTTNAHGFTPTKESAEHEDQAHHTRDMSTETDGPNVARVSHGFRSFETNWNDTSPGFIPGLFRFYSDGANYIVSEPGSYIKRSLCTQTDTYTPVTLVNFPLEGSVMGTMTPLTLACLQGSHDAVLLLLRHGASPSRRFSHTRSVFAHDVLNPLDACVYQLNMCANDILTAFKNEKNHVMSQQPNSSFQIRVTNYTASSIYRAGSQTGYHHAIMFQRGSEWLQCLLLLCSVMKTWSVALTNKQVQLQLFPSFMG